jgi:hypothetical protein
VAFIIDIAGAKLRKARSHVDSMLLFAVSRRRAVGDAQSAPQPIEKKGDRWRSVAKAYSSLLFFHHLRWFGRELHGTGQHGKRSALLLNLHQDQTKFWLHTGVAQSRIGKPLDAFLAPLPPASC